MTPLRPYERFDTLCQFLEHEGHVLRFYGVWDDTETMFGDIREVVLHYFLADDTIEIKEVIPVNSGRDAVPLFLNRQKLPKVNVYVRNFDLIFSRVGMHLYICFICCPFQ